MFYHNIKQLVIRHLSDKVIYELSTCGTQGPTGPSHYECALYYTDHDNVDVDSGIQKVYIEDSGVYRVSGMIMLILLCVLKYTIMIIRYYSSLC